MAFHIFNYDSIAAAQAAGRRQMVRPKNAERVAEVLSETCRGESWYGLPDFAETTGAIASGWPAGAARIEKLAAELTGHIRQPEGVRRKPRRSDQGDSLDIHSVYRGNCDKAWTVCSRKLQRGTGSVRLVVDVGGNCHVDANSLQWRGVACAALARVMERAGYSLRIDAAFTVGAFDRNGGHTGLFCATVKPQGSRVNSDRLAVSIGLAGFFRTVFFSCIIAEADKLKVNVDGGLGHVIGLAANADKLHTTDRSTLLIVPETVVNEANARQFCNDAINLLRLA